MTTERAHIDTKAYWRRRALRAEAELATIRQIRQAEAAMEIKLARENAARKVALGEIIEIVADLDFALKGGL
jgi:hypothetical protein